MIVYPDLTFLLSLLTDYLLCLSAARLCGLCLKRWRYLIAAAVGAAYALLVQLSGDRALASPLAALGVWLGMSCVAFGGEARPWRCAAVLLLAAALFGGLCYALSLAAGGPVRLSPGALLSSFFFCYGLLRLLTRNGQLRKERALARVDLRFLGHAASFTALRDSGNALCDPVSGAGVLIASPHSLAPVLQSYAPLFRELAPVDLLQALEQVPALRGRFRLIPFHALSGSGLLPAFRPDELRIDGAETKDLLVAVSERAQGPDHEAIV